jgi:N-acetylneuraminic acid mutarotase
VLGISLLASLSLVKKPCSSAEVSRKEKSIDSIDVKEEQPDRKRKSNNTNLFRSSPALDCFLLPSFFFVYIFLLSLRNPSVFLSSLMLGSLSWVFSGTLSQALNKTQTMLHSDCWTFSATTFQWTRFPYDLPEPRAFGIMLHTNESAIIYGGLTPNVTDGNKVLVLDETPNGWHEIHPIIDDLDPATMPPPIRSFGLVGIALNSTTIAVSGGARIDVINGVVSDDVVPHPVSLWYVFSMVNTSHGVWSQKVVGGESSSMNIGFIFAEVVKTSDTSLLVAGGAGGLLSLTENMWTFDFISGTVTLLDPPLSVIPTSRAMSSSVMLTSQYFLLFGGLNFLGALSDVWIYDILHNYWTRIPIASTPSPRMYSATTFVDGSLYIYGGFDDVMLLQDTWLLDFESRSWKLLHSSLHINIFGRKVNMLTPRSRLSASLTAINNSMLFLYGGLGSASSFDDTWLFNLTDNTWATFFTLGTQPNGRYAHTATLISSSPPIVAIFGGVDRTGFGTVAIVDSKDYFWSVNLVTGTWSQINSTRPSAPSLSPIARAYHTSSLMLMGSKKVMVVFGGRDMLSNALDDTWLFDFDATTWTLLTPLKRPSPRFGHASSFIDQGLIILVHGYHREHTDILLLFVD